MFICIFDFLLGRLNLYCQGLCILFALVKSPSNVCEFKNIKNELSLYIFFYINNICISFSKKNFGLYGYNNLVVIILGVVMDSYYNT